MKHFFTLLLLVFLGSIFLPAQTPLRAGKDYALFFVVTDFDYWPDLPGIDKPLREIATELETNYGFQKADIRLNPSKAQILDALSAYQKRAYGPQDQLLVFFSMHGQYDEAIGALIPRDGKLEDGTYESWITHPALEAVMSKIPCAHLLLALDACYSGTFGSKYKGAPVRPAFEDRATDCAGKIKEALEKTSRLYVTSGGKERTPSKSEFAAKWLEALRSRNTDGLLSFAELYAVLLEARPQPMSGDFRGLVFGGDFVLAQRDLCAPKPSDPIEVDKADWRSAKLKNTVDGYFDYVTQHAQGLYVDDARDAIKRLNIAPDETRPAAPISVPTGKADNIKTGEPSAGIVESPDLVGMTPDSTIYSLHQMRGNIVFIDFWASWCGPYYREMPNIMAAYTKYKDQGFDILGVSLDRDMHAWRNAIKKNGLSWHHISDLRGWQSQHAALYSINSIPANVLVDKEGKIIARNLRGEELNAKLKAIFGY